MKGNEGVFADPAGYLSNLFFLIPCASDLFFSAFGEAFKCLSRYDFSRSTTCNFAVKRRANQQERVCYPVLHLERKGATDTVAAGLFHSPKSLFSNLCWRNEMSLTRIVCTWAKHVRSEWDVKRCGAVGKRRPCMTLGKIMPVVTDIW